MSQLIKSIHEPETLTERSVGQRAPLNATCCKPVSIAWFQGTNLFLLGRRHSGPSCAGIISPMNYRAWRAGRIEP